MVSHFSVPRRTARTTREGRGGVIRMNSGPHRAGGRDKPAVPGDPGRRKPHLFRVREFGWPWGAKQLLHQQRGEDPHMAPKFSPPEAVIHSILGAGQQADESPLGEAQLLCALSRVAVQGTSQERCRSPGETVRGHNHSVTFLQTQNCPFLPVGSAPRGSSLSRPLSGKERSGKLRYRSGTKPTSPCWFRACSASNMNRKQARLCSPRGGPAALRPLALPGWVFRGHREVPPPAPCPGQSPGALRTLTHSSASPSSTTSSHSPSVMVSSSSRPAWAPRARSQGWLSPLAACLGSPPPSHLIAEHHMCRAGEGPGGQGWGGRLREELPSLLALLKVRELRILCLEGRRTHITARPGREHPRCPPLLHPALTLRLLLQGRTPHPFTTDHRQQRRRAGKLYQELQNYGTERFLPARHKATYLMSSVSFKLLCNPMMEFPSWLSGCRT